MNEATELRRDGLLRNAGNPWLAPQTIVGPYGRGVLVKRDKWGITPSQR